MLYMYIILMDNILPEINFRKNLEWSTKIFVCINYAHYYNYLVKSFQQILNLY